MKDKGPKILLLDIETQPDLVWTWGVYEQNAIAVERHWQLLSFSAEWVGTGVKTTKGLPDYDDYKPGCDDWNLVEELHALLNEADAVVAHNGADFDLRKLNARFIAHGLVPPKPYKVIDTKREVSRVAGFSSNKLDWLAKQLEFGKKLEHEGWPLWEGCIKGEKKWWKKMLRYNRHDVVLLKRLYYLLLPWIRTENFANWVENVCPACGSRHLVSRGYAKSKTRTYRRWQCAECGKWSRSTFSEMGEHAKVVGLDANTRP